MGKDLNIRTKTPRKKRVIDIKLGSNFLDVTKSIEKNKNIDMPYFV